VRDGVPAATRPDGESPQDPLLTLLDPDESVAAERYTELSRRLVKYFEWRGAAHPEDLAQDAIVRVFEKIRAGLRLTYDDNTPYVFAVAHYVLLEDRTAVKRAPTVELTPELPASHAGPLDDSLALSQCLEHLPPHDGELVSRYYVVGDRDAMCRDYGLTPVNLRVKVHRLVKSLRGWVSERRPVTNDRHPS
jgi:DNA-directed RNA polymerase specialized sigma24 family protein